MNWFSGLFANPWMLAWLPVAAAPIIIHLWNRRKYREVSWAAMEYLLAAIVKSSKRMRIEQLLLLLIRIALIVLVVLALAEPFLSAVASPFVSGARTHRIIIIDGSYSMAYRPADKSIWEMAKLRAEQIVDDASEGDAFSLILMGDQPHAIVGTAAYDKADFIEEIESLRMPHGGANLPAALQTTEELIRQVSQDQNQLRQQHVYFLTDLGLNTWGQQARSGATDSAFVDRLERLKQAMVVEVVPLGKPDSENAAITKVELAKAYAVVTETATIQATVRNFSKLQRTNQLAELWIDGRRADQQFVNLLPGDDTVPIVFKYRFQSPGDHDIEIRIGGDSLQIDNHRHLVVPVKEQLDALLVSGKRGSAIVPAIAVDDSDKEQGLRGTFRPHIVSESAILELDLATFECIFLCNIGQFTASEAQVLHAYLQQGGAIITILGDQVMPDRYNRELAAAADGAPRILPARLGETYFDDKLHGFKPLGHRHPMLRAFKNRPELGLTKPRVFKFFRLQLLEDSQASVVMNMDTDDPAIVEEAIGRGRSILIATDISDSSTVAPDSLTPWSNLLGWQNFPGLIGNIWKAAVGGKIIERNIEVGEAFGARYESTNDGRLFITTPHGPIESIPPSSEADAGRWSFDETDFRGIYKVRAGSRTANEQKFAVNVDTRESDLQKLHPEDLPEGFTVRSDWQATESVPSVDLRARSFAMHRMFLYIVLGLLFTEVFLAWWIGHRSA